MSMNPYPLLNALVKMIVNEEDKLRVYDNVLDETDDVAYTQAEARRNALMDAARTVEHLGRLDPGATEMALQVERRSRVVETAPKIVCTEGTQEHVFTDEELDVAAPLVKAFVADPKITNMELRLKDSSVVTFTKRWL